MTAILGGFGAALCWTVAMLCSSRASRELRAVPTLAWVMAVGFVVVLPFVILAGSLPTGTETGWLLLAGVGNVVGLGCEYTAVRSGKVGIVAAIASTEGAIAAAALRDRRRADLGGRGRGPRVDRRRDRDGIARTGSGDRRT